jgi:hypothetical protein
MTMHFKHRRILTCPWLKKLGVAGLTLWPFIFIADTKRINDEVLLNHERIHLRQQFELLVLPFYILYLLEYGYHRLSKSHFAAYKAISFEREAYANETNLDYLANRSRFASFSATKFTGQTSRE